MNLPRRLQHALLSAVLLTLFALDVKAQPVVFSLETNNGNDTVYVGTPSNLQFHVDANGSQVQGLVFVALFVYTGGNWIGPMDDAQAGAPDNVLPSPAASATFASIAWNSNFGNGTNPDTVLYGFTSFGGPWTGNGEVWRVSFTPTGPGTLVVDPNYFPDPIISIANQWSALDPLGADLPFVVDVPVITSALAVTAEVLANCPGSTYEGGSVAIHIGSTVLDGQFQSLDLVSIRKNGLPVVPFHAPVNTGLGGVDTPDAMELITTWVPTAGEAGPWEFCYEATNNLGSADTTCAVVNVSAAGTDHMFWGPPFHYEFTPGGPFDTTLSWTLQHTTADVQGVVGPFILSSASGGAFLASPIVGDGAMGGDITAGPAFAGFASKSDNTYAGNAISPDTIMGGLVSFGAAVPSPGASVVFDTRVSIKDQEGIIKVDQVGPPGLPAIILSYNDPLGGTIFPTFSPGCYALTQVHNVAPTVQCPVSAVGPIVFGDPVSIPGFSYNDPDAGPGPYTFSVVSMEKDGNPAVPTNLPSFTGDTFNWQTSNANQDDVGLWEFCVQVSDGADSSTNTCCFTVNVLAEEPLLCFSIGCVESFSGSDVCVPLSATDYFDPCVELGGFDLLFTFDGSLLTFKGLDLTGSILESQDWEFLTYRLEPASPARVRIVAIADMNNSNHHPSGWCLDGLLANLCFRTTNDRNLACQSAHLRFYWEDCGDNTASSRDGNHLYIVTDPAGGSYVGGNPSAAPPIPGGGVISSSYGVDAQLFTGEGGVTGPADHPCPNELPNKPDPEELLCFVNGKIKIICPGDIDDRGDLNLNGLAYEIADAVLYSNYFILGPSVFTINPEGQIAASDVNADGAPLTVGDLVYLIRVTTGDIPIAFPSDPLGGGPRATASELVVTSIQQGGVVEVSAHTNADLGAALFVFEYSGARPTGVTGVGRAFDLDVMWEAVDGQLRVLLLPPLGDEHGARRRMVPAGTGPILDIRSHNSSVSIESVEAATFMGESFQARLESKVLPTQFALKQNFPNPFNPSTSLAIDFPIASDYELRIYNVTGQTVRTYSGATEAGTLTVTWDGRDSRGSQVATGVYFYSVAAGSFRDTKRMLLLR